MGQTSGMEDWAGLLSERFLRDGAYFVPAGQYDWDEDPVRTYTPVLEVSDDPDAWHPDDALMVPLRSADGALLGIVSVDEPVTGRRPTPVELELLSTVVANAAVAVEQAQTAELGRRHRAAVEHLLAVSAQLTERRTEEEVLDAVCWGVREALGFHKVVAFLADEGQARAAVGRRLHAGARRGVPARAGRGGRAAAGPGARAPRLRRHGARRGAGDHTRAGRRLLVGLQRPRAAGLEPPLGRRAAVRLGRARRRDDLGRRPEGPAAALGRGAPGAARVRQPGDGRDRVRAAARAARAPRGPRSADRAAQPPRLRARDRPRTSTSSARAASCRCW